MWCLFNGFVPLCPNPSALGNLSFKYKPLFFSVRQRLRLLTLTVQPHMVDRQGKLCGTDAGLRVAVGSPGWSKSHFRTRSGLSTVGERALHVLCERNGATCTERLREGRFFSRRLAAHDSTAFLIHAYPILRPILSACLFLLRRQHRPANKK